jgi:hypothetical protein
MCLESVFGGGSSTPTVVQDSPIADQAKVDADAAAKGSQDKLARRRRLRASSLLATGGAGDMSSPVTGTPTAKPTLGA